ncbi:unnamed protein product, partial [Chrysoparadoxa australica]
AGGREGRHVSAADVLRGLEYEKEAKVMAVTQQCVDQGLDVDSAFWGAALRAPSGNAENALDCITQMAGLDSRPSSFLGGPPEARDASPARSLHSRSTSDSEIDEGETVVLVSDVSDVEGDSEHEHEHKADAEAEAEDGDSTVVGRLEQETVPAGAATSELLYLGARVIRGKNWTYNNQDGTPGNLGTVVGWRGLDGSTPSGGDNPPTKGWAKVGWDCARANSYEIGFGGRYALCMANRLPGPPHALSSPNQTQKSITLTWESPEHEGLPPLTAYLIYRDGLCIKRLHASGHKMSFVDRSVMRGWSYHYS